MISSFRSVLAVSLAFVGAAVSPAFAASKEPTLRDQQQAACFGDAMRLCSQFVPSESKITVCMRQNKSQLSFKCAAFFPAER